MLVRPITTKPARRSRATAGASAAAGGESSNARDPARVTCPLMSNRSLIEIGMPANGDGAALTSRSRSIASAASIAASAPTWRKARAPSPCGSAILARHASTSARAVVRPASRSAAREARVGISGIVILSVTFNFHIQQRGTQRLAMRIQRQRARHAAAERLGHHEIQRGDVGQLIAHHLALDHAGKMSSYAFAGYLSLQQRIVLFVIGDHRDVGGVALVAGAGMGDLAQLYHHASTKRTAGFARSRGNSTDATATTSRADLVTPPPAAGPLV